MERKVAKFGNSLGVTMTDALKKIGLDQGDLVQIEVNESTGEIILKRSARIQLPEGIDQAFMNSLAEAISQYDQTLERLKDR
ncbi:AbrB/MazE/SpoVT family DNA-binding domain-containing protein [Gorillibacterium sp. sgz500922]|uniref:AbrB/MazE/SpoVT family DNA-binding domain-containing protein n=1 Tax=Gorillibacterium sp. sgz500922 TaxID=3446694 RepID=UPI003F66606F